ncbi:Nup85 Nucleoporin [Puccinia triticina 1-1 BBBD Race 1]|uniref:Nuclear pore complex protein Nup85 n=1 Tax=Puccinia triticina (isolate 1-1 / race 1 (BBBD)) TaxID=630390 RepID=A0A180GSH4_PUCT1|nr:Nup85 Nucleoporin [Puccinia triticina 1-1 BBBD Race 1]
MTHSIQLYPIPISVSTSADPESSEPVPRTCQTTWDPKRNGLALAVVPSSPTSTKKSDKQRQTITSVPDQSLYLINATDFKPSRRSFITRSYEVFSGLQRVVQLCEEEEGMAQDQIYLPGGVCLPSTSQLKYYYRIGNQYVVALKDYLTELEKDEAKNSEEIDLVLQMTQVFSLFVLVHVPADGRGDAIVSEEVLDWVNRTNPQPPKEEGEELSAMMIPYEHVNFWPYIQACVIRGHLTQACALLKPYTKTHNPTLNQLMTVTLSLIKSAPRSTSFDNELAFTVAVEKFREAVERSLITLESEMNVIFENEKNRVDTENAFDEDDLVHFQASYKILLEILSGDEDRISEACFDWQEALGAHLLWVNPFCKRDDLPIVMKKITTDWPIDQTSLLDLATSSIMNGDIASLLQAASQMDQWLICHLADLIDKLGISVPDHSRGFYICDFVDYLSVDQGLWRLMIAYLGTVGGTKERIKEILRRLVVEDLREQQSSDTMELDPQPAKTTTKVSMLEMKEIYTEHDMEDEFNRTARILSRRLTKQRKYGAAIAYAVTAGDLVMVSRISDCLLDEYLSNGPEEFAKLVDEIPSSLLHPTAPALRPGLFFDPPTQPDGRNPGERPQPNINSSKLLFLSRYRDMHSYYSKGERKLAAETLISLMTTEIAPKRWWAVCLIDVIPLLEDDDILISLADTYELLRCLEEITGPILTSSRDSYDNLRYLKRIVLNGRKSDASNNDHTNRNGSVKKSNNADTLGDGDDGTRSALEQLNVVRYALARHLARSLTCKH